MVTQMNQQGKKKPVLQDHKKVGQRLIPPFVAKMPALGEVSYRKNILPELLWIDVLAQKVGYKRATELTVAIAHAAEPHIKEFPCFVSSFVDLPVDKQNEITASLNDRSEISQLLSPLVVLYPECPLAFFCTPEDRKADTVEASIEYVSEVVSGVLDRMSRKATMMQSCAVFLALSTGRLTVFKGQSLES